MTTNTIVQQTVSQDMTEIDTINLQNNDDTNNTVQDSDDANNTVQKTNDADNTSQKPQTIKTPEILKQDYQFLRLIGEGANGKTWLAISRIDQKKVAIKALKLVDTFKSLELFKREAETLQSIQIDGVPKFIEFIESDNFSDECYLIQEYFDYPSIQQLIDKNNEEGKTFSEKETLNIMKGVAEILHALQTQYTPPIIHRDIKPSNILYDALQNKVMLIDFGSVATPAKKTEGSTVAGTQGFMAPEQMLGECTTQSDFYGLGATALNMLTGTSPVNLGYDKVNPFQLKFDEIFKKINISQSTQNLLTHLLSPQIEDRPQTTTELQEAIENHSNAVLCMNHSSQSASLLAKWFSNPIVQTMTLIGIIVLIIGLSIATSNIIPIIALVILGILLFVIFHFSKTKPQTFDSDLTTRTLPCVNGYNNNEMIIQHVLSNSVAECTYYSQKDQRYKIYRGKVVPRDYVKFQDGTFYKVMK
jgi:serine/threonine protein kinase